MTFAPPWQGAKVMWIIIKHFIKGRMIFTPSKQLISPVHDFSPFTRFQQKKFWGCKNHAAFYEVFYYNSHDFCTPRQGCAKVMRIYTTNMYLGVIHKWCHRERGSRILWCQYISNSKIRVAMGSKSWKLCDIIWMTLSECFHV